MTPVSPSEEPQQRTRPARRKAAALPLGELRRMRPHQGGVRPTLQLHVPAQHLDDEETLEK
eukprot:6472405-Amphidinium_carterae.3